PGGYGDDKYGACAPPRPTGVTVARPPAPHGGQWPVSGNGAGNGSGRGAGSERGHWPQQPSDDDGWGPATAVYSASATSRAAAPPREKAPTSRPANGPAFRKQPARPSAQRDEWAPAGPIGGREERAVRAADRQVEQPPPQAAAAAAPGRGIPWWAALLVMIAIAAVGGVIDTVGSNQLGGGFNIGIVVASVVAILVVKRSHMFPVVIAPPIVYSLGAVFNLYLRSSGLHDKKVVLDAAANYLVYGFPAIAAATAAVLIIAGVRLISRR
ncbi:MAG TPA: DUF6542 domain-containing protein, partial [Jatrophihabitans sp.]|nr:DUF6542 domain-containing protein [Jatrophihabitans sp.]